MAHEIVKIFMVRKAIAYRDMPIARAVVPTISVCATQISLSDGIDMILLLSGFCTCGGPWFVNPCD
jgi:hypothetical protein